jgi:hypothetical protein
MHRLSSFQLLLGQGASNEDNFGDPSGFPGPSDRLSRCRNHGVADVRRRKPYRVGCNNYLGSCDRSHLANSHLQNQSKSIVTKSVGIGSEEHAVIVDHRVVLGVT